MTFKKVFIGCDHGGFMFKLSLIPFLKDLNLTIFDEGCTSEESTDYTIYAHKVSNLVCSDSEAFGILICRSGVGMSIAANRHPGIRAVLCRDKLTAKLARQHNNANILCLGADFSNIEDVKEIIKEFINTQFEGGRHKSRVQNIEIK